jgi:leucyl/phenylalanyl-tRNA---protein transferase
MIIPPDVLLDLYRNGLFPMADADGTIGIYDPPRRGIIPLDTFHVPDSLGKILRAHRFEIRIDAGFEEVMRACAAREETWISDDIVESYTLLHELGHAHSVEAWRGGRLVGGLYGVHLGGAFFGESMFHTERDASKVALVALVARMRAQGFSLLDTQYVTPHLERFGAIEVPRTAYRRLLASALVLPCRFTDEV